MANQGEAGASRPLHHEPDDWAVALVHGIGETNPLHMITDVTAAIKGVKAVRSQIGLQPGVGLDLSTNASVYEQQSITAQRTPRATYGNRPSPSAGKFYHVIRRGRLLGGNLRVGTAAWADIAYSRRQGLLNLIGALLMTAFGVRYFAHVAATSDNSMGRFAAAQVHLQQRLLNLMVSTIALVVFPVTFVTLVFSCVALLGKYIFKTNALLISFQMELIAFVAALLCGIAAWQGYVRSKELRDERPLGVPMFASMGIVAALLGFGLFIGDSLFVSFEGGVTRLAWKWWWNETGPGPGFMHYSLAIRDWLVEAALWFRNGPLSWRFFLVDKTGAFFALMHALQLIAGVFLLAVTLLLVVNLALFSSTRVLVGKREQARTLLFATVSVVTIWIINLILLWPENLATFAAMTEFMEDTRRKATITINTLQTETLWAPWTWSIEPLRFSLGDIAADRPGFMKGRQYPDTYPIMWFEAIFLVFIFAASLLVAGLIGARTWWCSRHSKMSDFSAFAQKDGVEAPERSNRPRLIISRIYVWLVVALITVVPSVLLAVVVNATQFGKDLWFLQWADRLQDVSVGAEWARISIVVFLAIFLLFSHRINDGARLLLDIVNHFTAPDKGYPVRERISQRFNTLINHLLSVGDKPNLVIIAHSQGTVITLDALKSQVWVDDIMKRVQSLTVITFGSPITHIYQQYFPSQYPKLAQVDTIVKLSEDDRFRWINVYRIDDFVGTYIENSIKGADGKVKPFPVNIPIGTGGHTNYWQPEVFEALLNHESMQGVLVEQQPQPQRRR